MIKIRNYLIPILLLVFYSCQGQEKKKDSSGTPISEQQSKIQNKTNEGNKVGERKTLLAKTPAKIGTYSVPITLHSIGDKWEDDELFAWAEPIRGTNDKLFIRELQPHILAYLEWYDRKTKSYLRGDQKGSQLIPSRLEFYNEAGSLTRTYDINAQSPYTRTKYPKIIQEHYYDGEVGFADIEYRKSKPKATSYWTNVRYLSFNQNGYVGIVYHLYGLAEHGGILFDRNTVRMFDYTGKVVFELKDLEETIISTLITPDGKYAVVNVGGEQDINAMSDVLSPEGFIIYEVATCKELYREYGENNNVSYGSAFTSGNYIRLNSNFNKSSNIDFFEKTILIDIKNRTIYKRDFTKNEVYKLIGNKQYLPSNEFNTFLFKTFNFQSNKF